jgi:hypothetical protein
VKNAKTNLVTTDSIVVATFTTICKSSGQDSSLIKAYLEYVGWVVLFCNWVKANYKGTRTTMKQDEHGFTLVNFNEMLPFLENSFAFLINVEQILFYDDTFLN